MRDIDRMAGNDMPHGCGAEVYFWLHGTVLRMK